MFTFCDVLHETKKKKATKFSRVRNMDWSSEFDSFKRIQGKSILGCVLLGSTVSGWLGRLEMFRIVFGTNRSQLVWLSNVLICKIGHDYGA